jgi:hypothetical protein
MVSVGYKSSRVKQERSQSTRPFQSPSAPIKAAEAETMAMVSVGWWCRSAGGHQALATT